MTEYQAATSIILQLLTETAGKILKPSQHKLSKQKTTTISKLRLISTREGSFRVDFKMMRNLVMNMVALMMLKRKILKNKMSKTMMKVLTKFRP